MIKKPRLALCLLFALCAFPARSAGWKDVLDKIKAGFKKKAPAQTQPVSPPAKKERDPAFFFEEEAPGEDQSANEGAGPVAGFGIKFHSWPNPEESQILIQYMEEKGLKKTGELSLSSKIWIFSWSDGGNKSLISSGRVCSELPKMPSIDSCFPDLAIMPHNSQLLKPSPSRSALRGTQSTALHDCKIVERFEENEILCVSGGGARCSGAIPSFNTKTVLAGRHWAQNMIGGDLLKEKITVSFRARSYLLEDRLKKKLI